MDEHTELIGGIEKRGANVGWAPGASWRVVVRVRGRLSAVLGASGALPGWASRGRVLWAPVGEVVIWLWSGLLRKLIKRS